MHRSAELLDRLDAGLERTGILIGGLVAVGAPVAQVFPGLGVEHDDPLVQVPVGDVELVGRRIHLDVGGLAEELGAVAALGAAGLPDLHHEGAVPAELEHLVIARTVARKPHVAQVVHEDAVLGLGPLVPLALVAVRVSPTVEQVPVGVELEHRRRRVAARGNRRVLHEPGLVGVQAAGPMDEPDVVVQVHRDPADFPDQPVVGKHGPRRIHRRGLGVLVVRIVGRCPARPFSGRLAAHRECRHQQCHKENRRPGLHSFLPGGAAPTTSDAGTAPQ